MNLNIKTITDPPGGAPGEYLHATFDYAQSKLSYSQFIKLGTSLKHREVIAFLRRLASAMEAQYERSHADA